MADNGKNVYDKWTQALYAVLFKQNLTQFVIDKFRRTDDSIGDDNGRYKEFVGNDLLIDFTSGVADDYVNILHEILKAPIKPLIVTWTMKTIGILLRHLIDSPVSYLANLVVQSPDKLAYQLKEFVNLCFPASGSSTMPAQVHWLFESILSMSPSNLQFTRFVVRRRNDSSQCIGDYHGGVQVRRVE